MPDLVLRADALPAIGSGHVMRCAALAEAWLDAALGSVICWGDVQLEFARTRLERVGVAIVAQPLEVHADTTIVCDSYRSTVRATIAGERAVGLRVLVDDLGEPVPHGFDIVWNPNAYGSAELYPDFTGQVLGGLEYIPIRSDMPRWTREHTAGTAVMLGGGLISPSLRDAVTALESEEWMKPLAGTGSWLPSTWSSLDPDEPWRNIVAYERLLTSAGITTWEAANAGIPVVLLQLADNQTKMLQWALTQGVPGINTGTLESQPLSGQLAEMSRQARPLPLIRNGAPAVVNFLERAVRNKRR